MTPIIAIQQRYRELGRIRSGEKSSRGNPMALDTWRLTTGNRSLLDAAAALWGGEVKAWAGAATSDQWELTTATASLPISIPPGREPVSQWMEQWTAGGCTHRCDTRRNTITDEPCSCEMDDPACKPTTRLSVMLPDLPDLGVWRLETHGWNAAQELPGTIQLIEAAAARGAFLEGTLRLEQRMSVRGGQTRRFSVPVIDLDVTPRALIAAGPHQAQALDAPPVPQLPAPVDLPDDPSFHIGEMVDVDAVWAALTRGLDETTLKARLKEAGVKSRASLKEKASRIIAQEVAGRLRAELDAAPREPDDPRQTGPAQGELIS